MAVCVTVSESVSGEPRERGGCLGVAGTLRSSQAVLTPGGGGGGEAGACLGSALGASKRGSQKYVKNCKNQWKLVVFIRFWVVWGGYGEPLGKYDATPEGYPRVTKR